MTRDSLTVSLGRRRIGTSRTSNTSFVEMRSMPSCPILPFTFRSVGVQGSSTAALRLLVSILKHPGAFSGSESTQPQPAAGPIPEERLPLSGTTAHFSDAGLSENTIFPTRTWMLNDVRLWKQGGSSSACGAGWFLMCHDLPLSEGTEGPNHKWRWCIRFASTMMFPDCSWFVWSEKIFKLRIWGSGVRIPSGAPLRQSPVHTSAAISRCPDVRSGSIASDPDGS